MSGVAALALLAAEAIQCQVVHLYSTLMALMWFTQRDPEVKPHCHLKPVAVDKNFTNSMHP